ncbi:hypothetical protein [Photobacterium nomapromontoriensis]|uniref:hypothetical protein n=1 Tax=Photobacterium nomapromontoriensis TaxID=2910237 RepID=UPI003D13FB85
MSDFFTDAEITEMKRVLAVNGFNSLLRLIVLHDKGIETTVSARRALGNYCSASGSTMKGWESTGLNGVFADRALEFAEAYPFVMSKHQLCPTKVIAEQWLNYDLGNSKVKPALRTLAA